MKLGVLSLWSGQREPGVPGIPFTPSFGSADRDSALPEEPRNSASLFESRSAGSSRPPMPRNAISRRTLAELAASRV
jgi:hypothetical protein